MTRVPLLEVIALDAVDARHAAEGGADRIELVADIARGGLTPTIKTFTGVRAAVALPVRVMLRLHDGYRVEDPDEVCRQAKELRAAGADEFVLGFLDARGAVDLPAVHAVLDALDGCAWTFHRAIDHAADRGTAWLALAGLPGLDHVLTAGAATGVADGLPALLADAAAGYGPAVLAGGGLCAAHLSPLLAGGVRAVHSGSAVRTGARWSDPVDPALVYRWRTRLNSG
jgi:copper homeostasis protein